ncbi:MAG: PGF-pre-PGF domain-containing protein, partial [Nanoarchaeota archaeon]
PPALAGQYTISFIPAGGTGVAQFTDPDLILTAVHVKVIEAAEDVTVSVEIVDMPACGFLTGQNLRTYAYPRIKVTGTPSTNIISGLVFFKVPKEWYSSNNLNERMTKFHLCGTAWRDLATRQTLDVQGAYIFEGTTPHFSDFAITSVLKEEVPKEETPPPEETPPEETPPEEITPPEEPPVGEGKAKPFLGWIIVAIVIVLGLAGYFIWKANNK